MFLSSCQTSGTGNPLAGDPVFVQGLARQVHMEGGTGRLRAGVSRREITPTTGTPLAGYARRRGAASQGVHDPLYVRVLILEDGSDRLIFASCDLVAIHEDLHEAVFEALRDKWGVKRQELFLFATHTHSGTGAIGKRFLERLIGGRYRKEVFKMTVERMVEAVEEALNNTAPARFGVGGGSLDEMIENRMVEGGPVDPEIKILRIDRQGRSLAFLVNMAAHPTLLNAKNFLFSADYPGVLMKNIESAHPGSVCVFANAAAGDLRIKAFTEWQGFERAEAAGAALARKVLKLSKTVSTTGKAEIVALHTELKLPPVKIRRGFLRLPSFIGNRLIPREVVINAARLNDVVFVSIPGEMSAELGLEIKKAAERLQLNPFLIGYANGYIGYIIPERHYGSDTYEAGVTFFGPRLDRYFVNYAVAQIRFLKEHSHAAAA